MVVKCSRVCRSIRIFVPPKRGPSRWSIETTMLIASSIIGIIARQFLWLRVFLRWELRCWFNAGAYERTMIVGLGLDIAEIDRIEAAITRHGAAILERLFTPGEVSYCERHKNRFERYAARFAAKEAAMKALGTGWSRGVRWRDIEVVRPKGQRPTIQFHGEAAAIAAQLGTKNIALSITHTSQEALAHVILEN